MSAPAPMPAVLETRDLRKSFGGHVVLEDVSLRIEAKRLSAIIGPNGAGKTTCINLLTGLLEPDRGAIREAEDKAAGIIRLVGLAGREHVDAKYLSYGQRRLLEIGLTLAGEPELLLMDEPSRGLAPRIVEDIMAVIQEIRDEGIAILLVEQNSSLALGIADRAYVIDDGRIVHTSRAADLEADPDLKHRLLAV